MRKRRADSFFGLHFDFHASPSGNPEPIGLRLDAEEIREICRTIRPDFIQIDCKGHPGWASYPSKIGNAMPAFRGDPLRVWRDVTEQEGVALYMHYSGVFDMKYCAEHPEDAMLHADGKRDACATSRMGRYDDDVMIPQLLELSEVYHVDGAWIDGECWGSFPDYDPRVIKAFEDETGIELKGSLPSDRNDPNYDAFIEFNRELFRRHVRRYVDAVHQVNPDFQIASNWAFTDHMPEPVTANVDFLSGDFDPTDSVNSARYAGRAIALQGRPWDLMSWNFRNNFGAQPGFIDKHPCQIFQEAATVISLGGGYQDYIQQHKDGSPRMAEIRKLKDLPAFIRARQPYCQGGRLHHEVAMLMATYDRHANADNLYGRTGIERLKGLTALICDSRQSLEIISEEKMFEYGKEIPVIVIPELFKGLDDRTVSWLIDYVRGGGSLVMTGRKTISFFAEKGLPLSAAERGEDHLYFRVGEEGLGTVRKPMELDAQGGEIIAEFSPDGRSDFRPFAVTFAFGKGKIAAVGVDLGSAYDSCSQYMHRVLMRTVFEKLYSPTVKVCSAEGLVDLIELDVRNKMMIQLVNMNGQHRSTNIATEDFIPPCRNICLAIRAGQKPSKVIRYPDGEALPFEYQKGMVRVTVPEVRFHEIICFE
ncbi:MAG: hypothetical protein II710_02920 [Clostridia bacterium]|nr:hypothetical protein [Clostridia bacterium]